MAEDLQGDLGRDGMGRRLADSKGSSSKEEANQVVEQSGTGQGKRKLMKENQKLKERLREAEAKKTKAGPSRGDGEKAAAPKKVSIKMPKGGCPL